jgi:hypothetical protein
MSPAIEKWTVIDDCRRVRDPDAPLWHDDARRSGWQLLASDSDLTAATTTPGEGILSYTTEDRSIARCRRSTANLSEEAVIEQYVARAPTTATHEELAAAVADATPAQSTLEVDQ